MKAWNAQVRTIIVITEYLFRIIQHRNYCTVNSILIFQPWSSCSHQDNHVSVNIFCKNLLENKMSCKNFTDNLMGWNAKSLRYCRVDLFIESLTVVSLVEGRFSKYYSTTSIIFLSTVSLFRVRVPVLSLHRTSIPAISSIAVILFVMAPWKHEKVFESCSTPFKMILLPQILHWLQRYLPAGRGGASQWPWWLKELLALQWGCHQSIEQGGFLQLHGNSSFGKQIAQWFQ